MTDWWKRISTKHPWRVITVAALVLLMAGIYGIGLFNDISSSDQFTADNTESMHAKDEIEKAFGASPLTDIVLFERKDAALGEATSQAYQAEVARVLQPLHDKVDKITTFADQPNEAFISKNKLMTYATVIGKGDTKESYNVLHDFVAAADQSRLKITIGGTSVIAQQMNEKVASDLMRAEMITFPILLVLLLFFFGSLLASLVPLGISLVTIVGAFALTRLMTHIVPVDHYALNVITILGLGLSIDYALLSINRFREELKTGSVARAVRMVVDTSGRTIFFSAITVIACMMALMVFPLEFLHSIAIGSASAILVAMIATVVVLPSVLMVLGKKIDAGHMPFIKKHKSDSVFWKRVASVTTEHPVLSIIVALAVISLALIPLGKLNLSGVMDYKYVATDTSGRSVMQKMAEDFSVQAPNITIINTGLNAVSEQQKIKQACELSEQIKKLPNVREVMSPVMLPAGMNCAQYEQAYQYGMLPAQLVAYGKTNMVASALRFQVATTSKMGSKESEQTLLKIRDITPSKGEWLVGGMEANAYDTNKAYMDSIPVALAIIAASMVVLLTLLLSSLIIPVQAVIINMVSLALSFAILIGVFQLGWLHWLPSWHTVDGIVLTPLVLIAVIAFGLAMDYSVFLYSRMYETHEKTDNPLAAIKQGIIKTGPIITAAALMVFAVVVAFVGSSVMIMQMIGLGLGVAVLVDAFFVRLLLVPAIMALVGKASWYAPGWVRRFKIRHE